MYFPYIAIVNVWEKIVLEILVEKLQVKLKAGTGPDADIVVVIMFLILDCFEKFAWKVLSETKGWSGLMLIVKDAS